MKVEIEIPDLEELYCSYWEGESLNGKDFKKIIVDVATDKIIDRMYDDYIVDDSRNVLVSKINTLVKENSSKIIDTVIDRVEEKISNKKGIKNLEPKNIDKEWEAYFIELIDKAIARKFKG